MTTKRGKKVQEAVRGERFTKSVVRVKLSPAEMVRILRQKNELTQSALADMASRHPYSRRGDEPAVRFDKVSEGALR